MVGQLREKHYEQWREFEAQAEQAVHFVGKLYRDHGIITTLYNRPLVGRTPMQLLQEHKYVAAVEGNDFNINRTFPLLQAMVDMPLTPARIDLAKLAGKVSASNADIEAVLNNELASALKGDPKMLDRKRLMKEYLT